MPRQIARILGAAIALLLVSAIAIAEAHDYNVWQLRQFEDGSAKVRRDDLVCILPAFDDRPKDVTCRAKRKVPRTNRAEWSDHEAAATESRRTGDPHGVADDAAAPGAVGIATGGERGG